MAWCFRTAPACHILTLTSGADGGDPSASPLKSDACPTVGQYIEGEFISLSAHPDAGYQVAMWSGTDAD